MIEIHQQAPEIEFLPEFDPIGMGDIRALAYEGMQINGKRTQVFAYYGFPESSCEKVPAVVLVHGGGGHAYSKWVKLWNDAGYAAIAMDTTGYFPARAGAGGLEGDSEKWIYGVNKEGYANAPGNDGFKSSNKPLEEQWLYHGVWDTVLAHNILRNDRRIDNAKIGITGISWGGVITAIAIGYDMRYAFAIPIYGAGYLEESLGNFGDIFKGEKTKELWRAEDRFDSVKMPVFWFNWNSDMHFSVHTTSKSYLHTVKNNPDTVICLKDQMSHGHEVAWRCKESYLFADSCVRGKRMLPMLLNRLEGRHINCDLFIPENVKLEAKIFSINEPMSYEKNSEPSGNTWLIKQNWVSYSVPVIDGKIQHVIDENVAAYYIELSFEEEGYRYVITSEYNEI